MTMIELLFAVVFFGQIAFVSVVVPATITRALEKAGLGAGLTGYSRANLLMIVVGAVLLGLFIETSQLDDTGKALLVVFGYFVVQVLPLLLARERLEALLADRPTPAATDLSLLSPRLVGPVAAVLAAGILAATVLGGASDIRMILPLALSIVLQLGAGVAFVHLARRLPSRGGR